jgi:hypothetical protein
VQEDGALRRRYPVRHPRPQNERQTWERELREELPAQLAKYQEELAATPPESRERRERLEWQIRRVQKRMAELEARLGRRMTTRDYFFVFLFIEIFNSFPST